MLEIAYAFKIQKNPSLEFLKTGGSANLFALKLPTPAYIWFGTEGGNLIQEEKNFTMGKGKVYRTHYYSRGIPVWGGNGNR
jgi:hypothetical protein